MSPTSCQTAPPRINRAGIIQTEPCIYKGISAKKWSMSALGDDADAERHQPSGDDAKNQYRNAVQA